MKTTLELPDELMREVKIRAVHEHRKLKDLIAELIRRGLTQKAPELSTRHRVSLPILPLLSGSGTFELTPERLHELESEAESHAVSGR